MLNSIAIVYNVTGGTMTSTTTCTNCAANNIDATVSCNGSAGECGAVSGFGALTLPPIINNGGTATPAGTYTITFQLVLSGGGGWTNNSGVGTVSTTTNTNDTYTFTHTITVLAATTLQITPTSAVELCDGETGVIAANVTAGAPATAYSWTGPNSFSATTASISVTDAGTYNVTVTSDCASGGGTQTTGNKAVTTNTTPNGSLACTAGTTSGTTDLTITFTNAGSGITATWFDDGSQIHQLTSQTVGAGGTLTHNVVNGTNNGAMTVTASNSCGNGNITGQPCSVVPIDLVRFNASLKNDVVVLEWTTASEVNNDYFTIERSFDGRNFEDIAQIKGAGQSYDELSYSYIDDKAVGLAAERVVYYRLKQTDFDGSYEYSDVISLELGDVTTFDIIEIFEEQSQIKVHFNAPSEGDVVASVFDLNGKLLQSQNYTAFDGFNEMNISTSGLQAGMYIVSLTNGGKHVSQKFVKFN